MSPVSYPKRTNCPHEAWYARTKSFFLVRVLKIFWRNREIVGTSAGVAC